MTITLSPELEAALNEHARKKGISSEALALSVLREKFAASLLVQAQDEWESLVLGTGTNCGVSLSHAALGSEGLYE